MHNLPIFTRPSLQRTIASLCINPPVSVSLVGGPLMGKSVVLSSIGVELSAAMHEQRRVVQVNCAQVRPGESPPTEQATDAQQVVLLDNFESIAQWSSDDRRLWIDWIASIQSKQGLLLASRRPIFEIATGLGVVLPYFQQSFLGLIDRVEATRLVRACLLDYPESGSLIPPLVEWCGGHPFLLDRVAELLADVSGMLPAGQTIGSAHLPLLRLRLAAAHGRLLFDSQWRAVDCQGDPEENQVAGLLHQLLHGGVPFEQLPSAQAGAMNRLLVQGLVGIDAHSYRLFSPLFQEYLSTKIQTSPTALSVPRSSQDSAYTLVEREAHRFTPQEKNLLIYFLDRPGAIVSVDELLAEVWRRPDGSARRVQEGIRRLRHRLAEFNGAVGTIDNEWGQGYRYVPVHGFG